MPDVWNRKAKPTGDTWAKVPKPTNTTTTTITGHAAGKFMGILGLTYDSGQVITTTTVDWAKVAKPNS